MDTKLSVNVNKVALLRNSRNMNFPNVRKFAQDCLRYGSDGITIHPRPDERHIRQSDVFELATLFPRNHEEFNIEGYPSQAFINLVLQVKPHQVTLVPDPPHVLTSSEGWNTIDHESFLREVYQTFKQAGIRVSLFMDTDIHLLEKAASIGVERIEFYTGDYAHHYEENREHVIAPFIKAAACCRKNNLEMNAGHDLNLQNLGYFKQCIPDLKEVSIGHALIVDCLYFGLENVIPMYQKLLKQP